MATKGWDIGMDAKYFYLFVKGKKKPVKKILINDASEKFSDGYEWGESEYKQYMRTH